MLRAVLLLWLAGFAGTAAAQTIVTSAGTEGVDVTAVSYTHLTLPTILLV